ncbi:hypothetical protein [Dongia sp.]|uniref:hypothetical protein n=1 Tax=Dongia sp. TaxID=1977262 RepID=UPI003751DFC3
MQRRSRIAGSILIALLILVGSAFATMQLLAPPVIAEFVDFTELKRSGSDALACAPGLCSTRVDLMLAPLPLSAAEVVARIKALPRLEPRTEIVAADEASLRYVLVQRSALFNVPDMINIALQPLDASHTALVLYSRAAQGPADLQMKRLQRWLDLLGVAAVG